MEQLHHNLSLMERWPKEKPVLNIPDLVPSLGMRFSSPEQAYEFYLSYGYRTGFGVSKRSCHTVDGIKYRATFVCYKGGKPRIKPGLKARRRLVAKTDCKATMVVKYSPTESNWEIVFLELEHNHPCNPEMTRFMMCFKDLPEWQRDHQPFNAKTRLNPKIHSGRGRPPKPKEYIERTFQQRNFGGEFGKLRFMEGDVEALLVFFDKMQAGDPNFFYSWDMDEAGRLKNVCWVDSRSRATYKYFGDVISFDTIYLTDRYVMPLVGFLGINHHGQFVLLGCGLLGDESVDSYLWLFKKWLKAMNDKPPDAIITSHTAAVARAAAEVFPAGTTRRRYNLWHIMRDLPELSGRAEDKETVTLRVKKVVYDTLTTTDFEREWSDMVKQYNLQDNHWLLALFEEREKWVPAYVKDSFWAGISTVRRSERLEAFFDGYVTPETTIKTFIAQYDTALKLRTDREAYDDFRSFQQSPQTLSGLLFEDQIAKIYTINVFQKFQDQVRQLMQVNCKEVSRTGSMVTYTVTVLGRDRRIDYRVVFNSSEKEVWCICRSFQFKGILCSHALAVLRQELVMQIPNKYILNRWKKDYTRLDGTTESENNVISAANQIPTRQHQAQQAQSQAEIADVAVAHETGNYDSLYKHSHQYFADIVELGAMDQDAMEFAVSVMKEAKEKIMKKLEASRGGATSAPDREEREQQKEKKNEREKEKGKGKEREKEKAGSSKSSSNKGKKGGDKLNNYNNNIDNLETTDQVAQVQAPAGMYYLPVRPMMWPTYPAVPPVPPVTGNVGPLTGAESSKKKRKRRGS